MDSADRIEAGAEALRSKGVLGDFSYAARLEIASTVLNASTPPIEQSGLVKELRTLAINTNYDIPDDGARLRYIAALHKAATALTTAHKERDEALEEALAAVEGERLFGPMPDTDDEVYERALDDVERAIRSLKGAAK